MDELVHEVLAQQYDESRETMVQHLETIALPMKEDKGKVTLHALQECYMILVCRSVMILWQESLESK